MPAELDCRRLKESIAIPAALVKKGLILMRVEIIDDTHQRFNGV